MGIVTTTVNKTHKMRAFLALTFLASLALSQKSECSNFLQFSTSRKRRQAVSTTVPPTTTTTEAKPQSTTAAVTTGTTGAVSQPVSTEAQPSGSTVVSGSVEPVSVSEPAVTTEKQTTTTTKITTTVQPTPPPTEASTLKEKEYIIFIDASGSMQKLGGPHKGQQTILSKMKAFLDNIKDQVNQDSERDGKITFITFNKLASVRSYDSINDVQELTRDDVKLGGPTNLYNALGCALEHLNSESPDTEKFVYIISDGRHQMPRALQDQVYYNVNEVRDVVNDYRSSGVKFTFFAATGEQHTRGLKNNAKNMGFEPTELIDFDFSKNGFNKVLTKISKQISANGAVVEIPSCQCPAKVRGIRCMRYKRKQRQAGLCQ